MREQPDLFAVSFAEKAAAPCPDTETVNGVTAEFLRVPAKGWLYRCPDIFPVNARDWRGHHPTREAARDDLAAKTATPVLTPDDIRRASRHGYLSFCSRTRAPLVLRMCPLTGATTLTPFVPAPAS